MVKYNDYPIEECINVATPFVAKGVTLYQKWTCQHCGSRQTMGEPNRFFRAGRCEECGGTTVITRCNYLLHGSGALLEQLMGWRK